jgi:hypothetical protein
LREGSVQLACSSMLSGKLQRSFGAKDCASG